MIPEQVDAFPISDLAGMVHRRARRTEVLAAEAIKPGLSDLQSLVLEAVRELGQATAEQVEKLPRFSTLGPSTVRKRLSELSAARSIVECGEALNSRSRKMTLWRVAR